VQLELVVGLGGIARISMRTIDAWLQPIEWPKHFPGCM
jgi:hypothetical protein